jgi:hypothetical protein
MCVVGGKGKDLLVWMCTGEGKVAVGVPCEGWNVGLRDRRVVDSEVLAS